MIVCVCNNVSDGAIKKSVQAGATSMVDLRRELQVGSCCGKCISCAKNVLSNSLAEADAATGGVPMAA